MSDIVLPVGVALAVLALAAVFVWFFAERPYRWVERENERLRREWWVIDTEHELGLHAEPQDNCPECCFAVGKLGPVRTVWGLR